MVSVMVDIQGFKEWLKVSKTYTPDVISDLGSRLKRADTIKEWVDDETYLFYLEKEESFKSLSVSVKSQLRRAVKLYTEYLKE